MFDWRDFVAVAESLANEESEAAARSSISRAYYAIFGVAKELLEAEAPRFEMRSSDSHKKMWARYDENGSRLSRRIFSLGNKLRSRRQDADYRAGATIKTELAALTLTEVRTFMKLFDEFAREVTSGRTTL